MFQTLGPEHCLQTAPIFGETMDGPNAQRVDSSKSGAHSSSLHHPTEGLPYLLLQRGVSPGQSPTKTSELPPYLQAGSLLRPDTVDEPPLVLRYLVRVCLINADENWKGMKGGFRQVRTVTYQLLNDSLYQSWKCNVLSFSVVEHIFNQLGNGFRICFWLKLIAFAFLEYLVGQSVR